MFPKPKVKNTTPAQLLTVHQVRTSSFIYPRLPCRRIYSTADRFVPRSLPLSPTLCIFDMIQLHPIYHQMEFAHVEGTRTWEELAILWLNHYCVQDRNKILSRLLRIKILMLLLNTVSVQYAIPGSCDLLRLPHSRRVRAPSASVDVSSKGNSGVAGWLRKPAESSWSNNTSQYQDLLEVIASPPFPISSRNGWCAVGRSLLCCNCLS